MNTSSSQPPVADSYKQPSWFQRIFTRRVLGRLLAGFLIFLTLVVLFYVEEKVRGRWAWNRYKQQLVSQGISVDIKAILPPALPPEKNFARAPLLMPVYDCVSRQVRPDTAEYKQFEARLKGPQELAAKLGNYAYAPSMSGGAWRKSIGPDPVKMLGEQKKEKSAVAFAPVSDPEKAAQLILDIYRQSSGPMLDELQAEARTRTYSNFDIKYDTDDPFSILLPYLANFKTLGQQSATRAMAELYLKQSDAGFRDTLFALHMSETLQEDPLLIAFLVSVALREIAIYPVWYGLATHQWNAAQLQHLQTRFEAVNRMADFQKTMQAERILCHHGIEGFARRFPGKFLFSDLGEFDLENPSRGKNRNLEYCLSQLYPKGWFYFEIINYQRLFLAYVQPPIEQARLDVKALDATGKQIQQELAGSDVQRIFQHKLMAGMLLPALGNVIRKAANSHMANTLAATACSLERYRLDHGAYPPDLAELTPKYMRQVPQDLMSGQALKYQVNADGTFKLYSFGRNGVDDGGTVVLLKSGNVNQEEGDWVWQYPVR